MKRFIMIFLALFIVATTAWAQPQCEITTVNVNIECNSIEIIVSVNNNGQAYQYYWAYPGGSTPLAWSDGPIQGYGGTTPGYYRMYIHPAGWTSGCESDEFHLVGPPNAVYSGSNSRFWCNDATATATPTGGTAPYTYQWDANTGGQTTQTAINLAAPDIEYYATVTDSEGCSSVCYGTPGEDKPICPADKIFFFIPCEQDSITLDADILAQDSSHCVTEFVITLVMGTPFTDSATFGPGAYDAWLLRDSVGMCERLVVGNEYNPPNGIYVFKVNGNVTHQQCEGPGSIDLSIAGPPGNLTNLGYFTYLWSNGLQSQDIELLSAGTYTVTVTHHDENSDTITTTCTFVVEATGSDLSVNLSPIQPTCFGGANGQINANVSGGTAPYQYDWSTGAETQMIFGLIADNYSVTVTDANDCIATASVVLGQPGEITTSVVVTNNGCNGNDDGAINLTVYGGTLPYTYVWTNGATTQDINNLAGGTYTVTVTDANGCKKEESFSISNGSLIVLTTTGSNTICGGCTGSASVTASGGWEAYTYLWSNNASTYNISNLCAGTYSVTVTDDIGCTAVGSYTVVSVGSNLAVGLSPVEPACYGGSNGAINANVTGGTLPYQYEWSTGDETQMIFGLIAGTYSVTVTDGNDCVVTASVNLQQPAQITVTSVVQNNGCTGNDDGSIDITVSGGTPTYNYLWNTGATTQDIQNLAGGTYTVTVIDTKECIKTHSVSVSNGSEIVLTTTGSNTTCGACIGTASVTASGGWEAYVYLWNTGDQTPSISGLCAGTYTVTVTDDIGCTAEASFVVGSSGSNLTVNVTGTNISCFGGNNGTAEAHPVGGTGPFTYHWVRAVTGANSTTKIVTGLQAGTSFVTVTDVNGCTATGQITLTAPPQLVVSITVNQQPGCGVNNGKLTANVSGGTTGYTYLWNTGAQTSSINGLGQGNYSVLVTDDNGCTKSANIFLYGTADTVPPVITYCPQDYSIGCSDWTVPTDLPTFYDACDQTPTIQVEVTDTMKCGAGFYERVFTVTDDAGNSTSCTQFISIFNDDPTTVQDIIWPPVHQYVSLCEVDCEDINFDSIPLIEPYLNPNALSCGSDLSEIVLVQNVIYVPMGQDNCTALRKWQVYDCAGNLLNNIPHIVLIHITWDDCFGGGSPSGLGANEDDTNIAILGNPFSPQNGLHFNVTTTSENFSVAVTEVASGKSIFLNENCDNGYQNEFHVTNGVRQGVYVISVNTEKVMATALAVGISE